MKWTEKQLEVINTRGRNILVSAAAGSGKTAVLVERVVSMITDKEKPIDIDRLLVVTFTRAAASEMKERVRERLEEMAEANPEDANLQRQMSFIHNAQITTIDSFCARVVKENFEKIDLDPNYRIADEMEIEMLKSDIIDEMLQEYYEEATPEFMALAGQYSTGKVADNISNLINLLYKYASGYECPEDRAKKYSDSYNVTSAEELEESSWMQEMISCIKNQIASCLDDLEVAINIAESEDGPQCRASLEEFMDMIVPAENATTYTEMKKALDSVGSVRLNNKRGCNKDKKDQVASIKKGVANSIKDIRERYFCQDIEEVFCDIQGSSASVNMIVKLTLDFMERFKAEKKEKGIVDFTDQARYALLILNDTDENGHLVPSQTAKDIAVGFDEIMIDEYQDSNYIQEAILTSVSNGQGHNNMFMVGDVKQSIYRFRQAEPKLFLNKYDTYSSDLNADNCKIILDKNFRSRKEVLDSTNYVFDHIMHRQVGGIDYRDGNRLALGADYDEPPEGQDNNAEFIIIDVPENSTASDNKNMEAAYVAQKIKEITDPVTGMEITAKNGKKRKVTYKDVAILLRSMKGNSEIYLQQMENNGVPAYAETKTGYYQALEVKTVLNMLSIIDNPRQDIPLAAVMSSPMYGFTDNELAVIKTENVCNSFYESVITYAENGGESCTENGGGKSYAKNAGDENLVKKTRDFLASLNEFRDMVPYTGVYDLINIILEKTGYDYYIKAMVNGRRRQLNIEALKEKAAAYDQISYKGLFNFIRYIEKLKYLDRDDGEASAVSENENIVHIMSIHKSKGLQFPVVFVSDTAATNRAETDKVVTDDQGNIGVDYINEKLKVKSPTLMKEAIKLKNKEEDAAERLRILYVAMTRAKEKLFITGVAKKPEETKQSYAACRYDSKDLMSYNNIVNSKNMMDWVGKTLGKNKALNSVCVAGADFAGGSKIDMYNVDCAVTVSEVEDMEVDESLLKSDIKDEIKRETLELLENPAVAKPEVRDMLNGYFSYEYPFAEDINLHSKASVTELKKQSMSYDEEQDGYSLYQDQNGDSIYQSQDEDMTYQELNGDLAHQNQSRDFFDRKKKAKEDVVVPVPEFAKSSADVNAMTGAERGTAYHRVFELLDMTRESYSVDSIKEMIDGFMELGMLEEREGKVVNARDIYKFTKTQLFGRMQRAYERNELYRERKFLLGILVSSMRKRQVFGEQEVQIGVGEAGGAKIETGRLGIEKAGASKARAAGIGTVEAGDDETMIIQGVIDACFVEDGKYAIVDYKTDRVRKPEELVRRYKVQLECYKEAVERIAGIEVSSMIIYSVCLGEEIEL